MTINQLQKDVDEWIKAYGRRYFDVLTNMGILMEETGELTRHLVRQFGEQSYKETAKPESEAAAKELLADEMADILWVLSCLANQTGINLTDAMQKNFIKKTGRDADRHLQNEKLDDKS